MPTWKSNTLVFLKYNNYYNRIVKREDDFLNYLNYELFRITATNFNPNDGVNTEHIVNMEDGMYPDYMVVFDEASQLVSRWFVVETNRIRGGQYKVLLHRDTIADYYNDIISAPCFIEKATLDANDPLIFNEEDMTFNQIKTTETLLKDKSDVPWIVGYYSKEATLEPQQFNLNKDIINYKPVDANTITNWKYSGTVKGAVRGSYKVTSIKTSLQGEIINDVFNISIQNGEVTSGLSANISSGIRTTGSMPDASLQSAVQNFGIEALNTRLVSYFEDNLIPTEYDDFLSNYSNGDLIQTGDQLVYQIFIEPKGTKTETKNVIVNDALFLDLKNIVSNSGAFTGTPNAQTFKVEVFYEEFEVTYQLRADLNMEYSLPANRLITEDAPYDIFAIPYGILQVETKTDNVITNVFTSKEIGLAVASSLIVKLANNLYDIQLLPYCPIQNLLRTDYTMRLENDLQATPITNNEDNSTIGYIFHVPKSQFSFNIVEPININATALDQKISNQCDKYRLCSPNFNSYFDFSPAKNGGVRYFNVDCCYKPFQPYIHVNPDFGGLYGEDFNDPRGLICSGDFSLTQIQDQWESYQIQNKNFQEIFNRQIENMEVQNKYQRQQDIWTAVAGTIGGGVSGTATGLLASAVNPVVAGITGAAGALVSGLGGIADVNINQALRNEAIDYTKDNFGYQLGNIQALPNVLTKVSSLNNNNKIFPILEYYTCTDREKQAFRDKLKYNGMTVMVIGVIGDYIKNELSYIKGKIIRLPEINEDYHLANEIAREINLGIYI